MKVLAIDIEGTHLKILASGQKVHGKFDSWPTLSPRKMVVDVQKLAPGRAVFNFEAASGCSVEVINDAARRSAGLQPASNSASEEFLSSTIATPLEIESSAI